MPELIINVADIEALQMIRDIDELNRTFARAKSTIVQGGTVVLARKSRQGTTERFDEITTQSDLNIYKESVYKHL